MVEGIQNSFLCFPGKTQWTPTLLLASDQTCDQLSLLSLVNSFEALAGPASARRQHERNGGMAHVPGSASTTLRACLPQKLPKQLGLNKLSVRSSQNLPGGALGRPVPGPRGGGRGRLQGSSPQTTRPGGTSPTEKSALPNIPKMCFRIPHPSLVVSACF